VFSSTISIFSLTRLSEVFTVIVGLTAVGGAVAGFNKWVIHRKSGPASDRILLHTIDERLVGETPSPLNPNPQPGLIKEVTELKSDMTTVRADLVDLKNNVKEIQETVSIAHDDHAVRLSKLEIGQENIIKAMLPNGLKSDMPGDVLQHVLRQNEAIMRQMGIDPDKYNPKTD
jgi:hypothetical protein